jgi:Ni,Fe-hydrogenase I large subunit
MGKRVVVDPITRIEGHLRIEVEVAGGKVVNAWSSGQMFRGIELILQGRDPAGCAPFCGSDPAASERTPMLCPR